MPGLIPLIKKVTPDRPVIYRSHIQIKSDLCATENTPQHDVWQYLWKNIQQADMFISHPIPDFVPHDVPREKVAYMPATTDWLDGLNKPLNSWIAGYYGNMYNQECHAQLMYVSSPSPPRLWKTWRKNIYMYGCADMTQGPSLPSQLVSPLRGAAKEKGGVERVQ